ncbi:MAG: chitobiase/beta-hexosaminidase C-terminal domain-containing protein [Clostridia bacterium]|nr:chitobiase/beta-hexosaminidase C-terminal domain-containing protein [Clostridia bacterium]
MRKRRILSFLMSAVMLSSVFTFSGFAHGHNNDADLFSEMYATQDPEKSLRTVYLHAQGDNPTVTPNLSTVYMGDTAEIYFAVDKPNKGDYNADGTTDAEKHLEPHYDLNGYTVKIYFDPAFFAFVNDSSSPIDYTVPDKNIDESGSGKEEVGSGSEKEEVENTPTKPGYFPYKHGSTGIVEIGGKDYRAAFATIFFSGSWLPQEEEELDDEGNPIPAWYNLAKLPLTPLKTGNTEVFIDVDGADEFTLELFAKNTTDEYSQTFLFDTVNGGYHQIIIKDKLKPDPPVPTPIAGKYTETQYVTLKAEDGCDIYYSIDGGKTVNKYTDGEIIEIEKTTEIVAYAKRLSDGRDSNTVTYTYQIVPKAPLLYDDDDTSILLPNIYNEYSEYSVLVSNKTPYGSVEDFHEIFYTFSDIAVDEALDIGGENPSTEWVTLQKATQSIEITKSEAVRLYTRNMITGEISDVAVYHLSIKPDVVVSDHDSGEYTEKIDVKLSTATKGAEIYYTTNQTDPVTNGILYDPDIPLTLYRDTTLRAVAKYDGVYGDISSYYYIFNIEDDYGVDAFYPSGVYEGSVNVTLTPYNPENTVQYSVDGGKKWQTYKDVLVIDADTEILARAVDPKGNKGEAYVFTYKIKPLAPEFAPESTQFTNSDKVTIFSPESTKETTERYDLYYTLDGSDPITSKTRIKASDDSDSATILISKYTTVSAVVLKDGTSYSNVVTHSYDIVTKKPIKPITTLTPGSYTHEIGEDGYTTKFLPIPEGTQIYYTISTDGTFTKDPVPGEEGTYPYDGAPIDIKGHTIIKAVAVNVFGVKSDIGIFEYVVTPESPVAAPSGTTSGDRLPIVLVSAVEGSTVKYEIGDGDEKFENEFVAETENFYIDTNTGNAYLDPDCTMGLGDKNDGEISSPAILHLYAELDGITSQPNTYVYSLSDKEGQLAPPYPDKDTGVYEEIRVIEGDEDTVLEIKLYSINYGDTIYYKLDTDEEWTEYDPTESIKLTEDAVLLMRSEKDGSYSAVVSYVYNFVPLAPIITLPSGTYSTTLGVPSTMIELDPRAPKNKDYTIFYRRNGDSSDYRYTDIELEIDHTMSFKAYVINEDTERKSSNTIHYYIIETASQIDGSVYIANPYDVDRISAHVLNTGAYAEGIKLLTLTKDAKIQYYYTYKTVDGKTATTNNYIFDNAAPIFVNNTMEEITIYAKLLDKDGNEIEMSEKTFHIDFVHLGIPPTSLYLANPTKIEHTKNTKYTLINEHEDDESIVLYYTLNGSDPSDPDNPSRMIYKGEELKLTKQVTVKTVYFSPCDGNGTPTCISCRDDRPLDCHNAVYGEVGTYNYNVPTQVGGGGELTPSRKYTKDYFGYEHPTHISYINGYPDGSVQADGHITREEMAAILYRVKNKQYDEPFTTTGKVFPDVEKDRWSVTEIEYMAKEKVILGYPEGDFRPTNNLTRAEFAALIRRFTSLPDSKAKNIFPDLEEGHWAFDDIMALYSAGFLNGYEDGTMRPENQITRAEVMKVMNIILGRKPVESYVKSLKVNPFNDLEGDKWYYVDVLEATITHNYYLDSKGYENKWEDIK